MMREKTQNEMMNHEYLMTNGLGGYSFGTWDQVNCRKYHSLYTVSFNPPTERMHLISKVEESFLVGNERILLAYENVSKTKTDENQSPQMTQTNLEHYTHKGIITQTFNLSLQPNHPNQEVQVTRTHAFKYGTNHLAVRYEIGLPQQLAQSAQAPIYFELTPWFNFRDHHDVQTPEIDQYSFSLDTQDTQHTESTQSTESTLKVSCEDKAVYMHFYQGQFQAEKKYSKSSYYPIETQRGYPDEEKHVQVGAVRQALVAGKNIIEFSVHIQPEFETVESVFENRVMRYQALTAETENENLKRLYQAADDFIVYRKTTGKKTIIAGYPWFTDWGRDTMIAIPGLTLETGRADEALEMIEGFLEMSQYGIIPNNFPDEGQPPMYNTSDGTLWLFNALYLYYLKTKNISAIQNLYPKLSEIMKAHIHGTINDIFMDEDGLLSTGNETTQLTWMDVKVNGWVVTPRHGKAVEINALWYNALAIMHYFTDLLAEPCASDKNLYQELLTKVKASFNEKFWNEKDQNLYDLVIDGVAIDIPRPNMIFSVSLPFAVLDEDKWQAVVSYVQTHFKVAYGLLTLRREDENFHPKYEGDLLSRDGAYHRGTAWGWLIGPYLEAHYKTYGDRNYIDNELKALFVHLDEGVHGSISEIFEGASPHEQRGCPAQAWSVAEAIRISKLD